jgi:hypothetical protein
MLERWRVPWNGDEPWKGCAFHPIVSIRGISIRSLGLSMAHMDYPAATPMYQEYTEERRIPGIHQVSTFDV